MAEENKINNGYEERMRKGAPLNEHIEEPEEEIYPAKPIPVPASEIADFWIKDILVPGELGVNWRGYYNFDIYFIRDNRQRKVDCGEGSAWGLDSASLLAINGSGIYRAILTFRGTDDLQPSTISRTFYLNEDGISLTMEEKLKLDKQLKGKQEQEELDKINKTKQEASMQDNDNDIVNFKLKTMELQNKVNMLTDRLEVSAVKLDETKRNEELSHKKFEGEIELHKKNNELQLTRYNELKTDYDTLKKNYNELGLKYDDKERELRTERTSIEEQYRKNYQDELKDAKEEFKITFEGQINTLRDQIEYWKDKAKESETKIYQTLAEHNKGGASDATIAALLTSLVSAKTQEQEFSFEKFNKILEAKNDLEKAKLGAQTEQEKLKLEQVRAGVIPPEEEKKPGMLDEVLKIVNSPMLQPVIAKLLAGIITPPSAQPTISTTPTTQTMPVGRVRIARQRPEGL